MSKKAAFRQSDVTKVARGLKAAGVEIANITLEPEGRITITTGFCDFVDEPSTYEKWKRARDENKT